MVGYTDFHPGLDCAAAFRDAQQLCVDMLLEPDRVKQLMDISSRDFHKVFDHFDTILKKHDQLSVTWMGIPSFKIRPAGKSVVVDLQVSELESFMNEIEPTGIFLCISADPEIQPEIIKKVERWR